MLEDEILGQCPRASNSTTRAPYFLAQSDCFRQESNSLWKIFSAYIWFSESESSGLQVNCYVFPWSLILIWAAILEIMPWLFRETGAHDPNAFMKDKRLEANIILALKAKSWWSWPNKLKVAGCFMSFLRELILKAALGPIWTCHVASHEKFQNISCEFIHGIEGSQRFHYFRAIHMAWFGSLMMRSTPFKAHINGPFV